MTTESARSALALVLLAACGEASASQPPLQRRVRVEEAVEVGHEERLALHGVIESGADARLAFTVGGRLQARSVRVGDRVVAGQVLARLDRRPFANAVAGLRATLARATADADQRARDAERAERLERTGAAATSTSEAAGAGLETARAAADGASVQLREARRQLGEAVLRAPRDGVITAVFLDPGTVVSAGSPVVAMSAEGGLELRVRAPVHRLASLATDGEVQLERNHGAPCSGRVAQVAQAADGSGLFPIRIDVSECDDGTALVAGESVLALLPQRRERELHVPLRAVIDPAGDSPYLWRNVDGAAERCRVEARGLRGDDRLAVTPLECELSAGDEVVTAGARHLFAGDRLEGAGEGERIIVAEQAQ